MSNNQNPIRKAWLDTATTFQSIHYDTQPAWIRLLKRGAAGKIVSANHVLGTYAAHAEKFSDWQKEGVEVFLLTSVTDGEGYTSDNVDHTWTIAVDLDYSDNIESLARSPFRPTLAIQTSHGRYHVAWVLKDPIPPARAKEILIGLALRLDGDPVFANLTQAIRLPGFTNQKYGTPVALLPWSDGTRTYDADELAAAFDVPFALNFLRNRQPRFSPGLVLDKAKVSEAELFSDLKSALEYIPADAYDIWYRIGMALHGLGDTGYKLWLDWSKKNSKFNQAEAKKKWQGLANAKSISIASVFYLAAKNGWHNRGFRNKSTSDGQSLATERKIGQMLADKMRDDFVATANLKGTRATYDLYQWNGTKYVRLPPARRRREIESAVRDVRKEHEKFTEFVRFLDFKAGSNNGLDVLCEHACEELAENFQVNEATLYPYLPVENGVLNLLSRELVPAKFRPLARREGSVLFDPCATAPLFLEKASEIFEGDENMVKAIIRVFGYILLGTPKEDILLVFLGKEGRNGKTVIVQSMRAVFGEFAHAVPSSVILAKSHNNEGATPALAKLIGVRLAIFSEPNEKHPLDAGFIKLMTGGEQITARALHSDLVEFIPEFTPIIVTNKIPRAPDDDHALWKRLKVVKFMRTFSDQEKDTRLKEKLSQEASGILNLLLDGIQEYRAMGLALPEQVKSAVEESRSDFDPFVTWLDECTVEAPVSTDTPLKLLAESYEIWARSNTTLRRMTKKELSAQLSRRFQKIERRNYPHFCGVALRE